MQRALVTRNEEAPIDDHHSHGEQHLHDTDGHRVARQRRREGQAEHRVAHRRVHQKQEQKQGGDEAPAEGGRLTVSQGIVGRLVRRRMWLFGRLLRGVIARLAHGGHDGFGRSCALDHHRVCQQINGHRRHALDARHGALHMGATGRTGHAIDGELFRGIHIYT